MNADQWKERWENNSTPWDHGDAHRHLKQLIELAQGHGLPEGKSILVPGCGRGHEAAPFAKMGYPTVGLDVVEEAITEARRTYPNQANLEFLTGDFFALEGSFGGIVDRAMLCAFPPKIHEKYVNHCHSLLMDGGLFLGILFSEMNTTDIKIPNPVSLERIDSLFSQFSVLEKVDVDPVPPPPFVTKEVLVVARK